MPIKYSAFKKVQLQGSSILEVLIAVVVIALGMLGIANMMLLSMKANNSSLAKQHALSAINNMIGKIRINTTAALQGNYNINTMSNGSLPGTPSPLCTNTACTASQLAQYDVWDWLVNDVAQLPAGRALVQVTPNGSNGGVIRVTVQWDDGQINTTLGRITNTQGTTSNDAAITIQSAL